MATDLRDASGVVLSTQEAEAVFELWAKRQADSEALRSRLTVQDMAEAMSIPPSEVQGLLDTVRGGTSTPSMLPPLSRVRPVNSLLIAAAAIAWIGILVFACFIAYSAGRENRSDLGPPAPFPMEAPSIAPFAEEVATNPGFTDLSSLGGLFSSELTIQFDKATIQGQVVSGQQSALRAEVLGQIVDAVSPPTSANVSTKLTDSQIVKALRSNDAKLLEEIVLFQKLTIKANNGTAVVADFIPVALTQDGRISVLVREEQIRRLKLLANEAVQKL